jgi:hypothetical protein
MLAQLLLQSKLLFSCKHNLLLLAQHSTALLRRHSLLVAHCQCARRCNIAPSPKQAVYDFCARLLAAHDMTFAAT